MEERALGQGCSQVILSQKSVSNMSAPMQEKFPLFSIYFLLFFYFFTCLCTETDVHEEFLLCRTCGHEVADGAHLTSVPSLLAIHQRNDTILGQPHVLIQLFKNPQGTTFEVVTVSDGDVIKHDQSFEEYTWFPGFSWQILICPRCAAHLGWYFSPLSEDSEQKSFLGLILQKLIHKSFADSILITPKSFKS
ncbi:protein cereblon-like isoform X2 [Lineus longissimus]|uniref:protein cereblon-like isoform X2 n=1 Tax=Lineus longissimus TaxID=88925 RepID=UPI002B4D1EF2